MNVWLMHPGRDLDREQPLPPHHPDLVQDLGLGVVLEAMAAGDRLVWDVAERALAFPLTDPAEIRHRQGILGDLLDHPQLARGLFDLAGEAITNLKKGYWGFRRETPDAVLRDGVRVLQATIPALRRMRTLAESYRGRIGSPGLTRLVAMVSAELAEDWLAPVERRLAALDPERGMTLNATLGEPWTPVDYVVRSPRQTRLWERLPWGPTTLSFELHPRDDAGFSALAEMRGRGEARVARAVAQAADHVRRFFETVRTELAFYVGCLTLHDRLTALGEPTAFPDPAPPGDGLVARGLYDVGLSLAAGTRVVGSDLDAAGARLVMVTGANQGGKSTFLRGVGLAQLMMQAGMFVGAESLRAGVAGGVFTHFKREEDPSMVHGKLDEELARMSRLADLIRPGCLLLCNESFSSTNEQEGSEIARQVVGAMTDAGVTVVFVTHLYDLAHSLHIAGSDREVFLRAERRPDGTRTFRIVPGAPEPTSFGEDLYRRILGDLPAPRAHQKVAAE
jgi:hypothetical protein